MASIFTHALVPIAAKIGLVPNNIPNRLLLVAVLVTALPDADVIAFKFDISYADAFGHRGFTHSAAFALFMGAIASIFAHKLACSRALAFWLIFFSTLSHTFLDSFTNGGLGVAILWPLSDARYFMPWQPILVSPIGVRNFFTSYGMQVLISEFFWVALPLYSTAFAARFSRRHFNSAR